jgi:hypothetical protein
MNNLILLLSTEPLSFNLMQGLGLLCVASFDCMPLYIRDSYKLTKTRDANLIYIAGSAAWLHLNILGRAW